MTDLIQQPEITDGVMVQSLIRRKGGTQVSFGSNPLTAVTYHFLPIDDTPNAPHVAKVANEEHLSAMLAIPEGYRLYLGDKSPVVSIPKPADEAPAVSFKNRFDDILSIDFNNIDNDEIKKWSEQVLKVKATATTAIKQRADDLDIDHSDNPTNIGLLRRIGQAMQQAEQRAIEINVQ